MYMNNNFSPVTVPMSNQSCFSKAHRAANGYPFTPSGLPLERPSTLDCSETKQYKKKKNTSRGRARAMQPEEPPNAKRHAEF